MNKYGFSPKEFDRISPIENQFEAVDYLDDYRFGSIAIMRNKEDNGELLLVKEKFSDKLQDCERDIFQAKDRIELGHPCLLRMVDYSSRMVEDEDRTEFLVSGYYEYPESDLEREIEKRIQEGRHFTENDLLRLIEDILDCLAFLQDGKMVHGDVRPMYIDFVEEDSGARCKLLDRMGDPNPPNQVQVKNMKKKKNLYMSPTLYKCLIQRENKVRHNPYKSDVFSLGVVILEAGLLHSIQDIYDEENKDINIDVLLTHLDEFCNLYDNELVKEIVCLMLDLEEKPRKDPKRMIKHFRLLVEEYRKAGEEIEEVEEIDLETAERNEMKPAADDEEELEVENLLEDNNNHDFEAEGENNYENDDNDEGENNFENDDDNWGQEEERPYVPLNDSDNEEEEVQEEDLLEEEMNGKFEEVVVETEVRVEEVVIEREGENRDQPIEQEVFVTEMVSEERTEITVGNPGFKKPDAFVNQPLEQEEVSEERTEITVGNSGFRRPDAFINKPLEQEEVFEENQPNEPAFNFQPDMPQTENQQGSRKHIDLDIQLEEKQEEKEQSIDIIIPPKEPVSQPIRHVEQFNRIEVEVIDNAPSIPQEPVVYQRIEEPAPVQRETPKPPIQRKTSQPPQQSEIQQPPLQRETPQSPVAPQEIVQNEPERQEYQAPVVETREEPKRVETVVSDQRPAQTFSQRVIRYIDGKRVEETRQVTNNTTTYHNPTQLDRGQFSYNVTSERTVMPSGVKIIRQTRTSNNSTYNQNQPSTQKRVVTTQKQTESIYMQQEQLNKPSEQSHQTEHIIYSNPHSISNTRKTSEAQSNTEERLNNNSQIDNNYISTQLLSHIDDRSKQQSNAHLSKITEEDSKQERSQFSQNYIRQSNNIIRTYYNKPPIKTSINWNETRNNESAFSSKRELYVAPANYTEIRKSIRKNSPNSIRNVQSNVSNPKPGQDVNTYNYECIVDKKANHRKYILKRGVNKSFLNSSETKNEQQQPTQPTSIYNTNIPSVVIDDDELSKRYSTLELRENKQGYKVYRVVGGENQNSFVSGANRESLQNRPSYGYTGTGNHGYSRYAR